MKIVLTLSLMVVSFFGLSQSIELSNIEASLKNKDLNMFWEQASKIVADMESAVDIKPNNPLINDAKSSSQLIGGLGTGSSRQSKSEIFTKNKQEENRKNDIEKRQSMRMAMYNLIRRKAKGDEKLMMTLLEQYNKE